MDYAALREAMISGQLRPNKVGRAQTIAAMRSVPRELFVPRAKRHCAYIDEDIEVAPGRWLMEPVVFARLIEAADVSASDAVLDIGCLEGYSTAVFAQIASVVVGLEQDADMVEKANEHLSDLELGNAAVIEGPLESGYEKEAPFDVIFLGGGVERIPPGLVDQLAEGGRLITVQIKNGVGRAVLGKKVAGVFGLKDFMDAQCPPLKGFELPQSFSF